nr:hypothetical protein [Tanacetum cinerariifolium]
MFNTVKQKSRIAAIKLIGPGFI